MVTVVVMDDDKYGDLRLVSLALSSSSNIEKIEPHKVISTQNVDYIISSLPHDVVLVVDGYMEETGFVYVMEALCKKGIKPPIVLYSGDCSDFYDDVRKYKSMGFTIVQVDKGGNFDVNLPDAVCKAAREHAIAAH